MGDKKQYFVLCASGNGKRRLFTLTYDSREALSEALAAGRFDGRRASSFMPYSAAEWDGRFVVIEGKIIEPIPAKVTEWELP